jgi:hypothetical protein
MARSPEDILDLSHFATGRPVRTEVTTVPVPSVLLKLSNLARPTRALQTLSYREPFKRPGC